jgi:hypothetical protein
VSSTPRSAAAPTSAHPTPRPPPPLAMDFNSQMASKMASRRSTLFSDDDDDD